MQPLTSCVNSTVYSLPVVWEAPRALPATLSAALGDRGAVVGARAGGAGGAGRALGSLRALQRPARAGGDVAQRDAAVADLRRRHALGAQLRAADAVARELHRGVGRASERDEERERGGDVGVAQARAHAGEMPIHGRWPPHRFVRPVRTITVDGAGVAA